MSSGKYRKEHNCLNCGSHVESHYCSSCGQPNLELKENFWGFIMHSIAHYFHFENKFFQTLKPLLTKPGQVTLDYLAGKRARYINPVSMYIFVSIVYFLVVPQSKHSKEKAPVNQTEFNEIKNQITTKNPEELGIINDTFDYLLARKVFTKLDFKQQEEIIKDLKRKSDSLKTDSLTETIELYEDIHLARRDSTYVSYLSRQKALPESQRDNWLERMLKNREIKLNIKAEKENWSIKEQIEHYRPKQYFLLMPLLALFIMWNFRKNKIYYLDHLIFTIHGMTAFFIVQIVTVPIRNYIFGLNSIMSSLISFGVITLTVVYLYRALKLFYQRSKKQTIKKMVTLVILFMLAFWLSQLLISQFIYYFLV